MSPTNIKDLGEIIDFDLGNESRDIVIDYDKYLHGEILEKIKMERIISLYTYLKRRFLWNNNGNKHLDEMIRGAQIKGAKLERYDTPESIMIIYLAYKSGGKNSNMEFDIEKRLPLNIDTAAPTTTLP